MTVKEINEKISISEPVPLEAGISLDDFRSLSYGSLYICAGISESSGVKKIIIGKGANIDDFTEIMGSENPGNIVTTAQLLLSGGKIDIVVFHGIDFLPDIEKEYRALQALDSIPREALRSKLTVKLNGDADTRASGTYHSVIRVYESFMR